MRMVKNAFIYPVRLFIFFAFFFMLNSAFSQSNITGKVVDLNELPIEFANVIGLSLPDSSVIEGAITDENGLFGLSKIDEIQVIKFSYIGYEDIFIPIQPDQKNYNVTFPLWSIIFKVKNNETRKDIR